jgi:cbb3-type cytochrome oxidase subunit 3
MKIKKILLILTTLILILIISYFFLKPKKSIYNYYPNAYFTDKYDWVETGEGLCLREYRYKPRNFVENNLDIHDSVPYDKWSQDWKDIYDKVVSQTTIDLSNLDFHIDGFGWEESLGEFTNTIAFKNVDYWKDLSDEVKAEFLTLLNTEIVSYIKEKNMNYKSLRTFVFSCEEEFNVMKEWVGYAESDIESVKILNFDWDYERRILNR